MIDMKQTIMSEMRRSLKLFLLYSHTYGGWFRPLSRHNNATMRERDKANAPTRQHDSTVAEISHRTYMYMRGVLHQVWWSDDKNISSVRMFTDSIQDWVLS